MDRWIPAAFDIIEIMLTELSSYSHGTMTELSSQLGIGENQVPAGLQLLLQTHLVIDSYLVPAFFFSLIKERKRGTYNFKL